MVRQGEQERSWFRSSRFTVINGALYFQTREGSHQGPYENELEAELELILYLRWL